jgi:S1-C subfamily serine protease
VVVRFDGDRVRSATQLSRLIRETVPGARVAIEVVRSGGRKTLRVVIGEKRIARAERGRGRRLFGDDRGDFKMPPVQEMFDFEAFGPRPGRLGVRFQTIEGQLARFLGAPRERGVLITHVNEGSPAEKGGLKAGDVVLKLDEHETLDGRTFRRVVGRAEAGRDLAVEIWREGHRVELTVRLDDPLSGGPETSSTPRPHPDC